MSGLADRMPLQALVLLLAATGAACGTESSSRSAHDSTQGVGVPVDSSGFEERRLRALLVQHSELVDPFSVEFRRTKYDGDNEWCGELNAKNRMGAYTGWVTFNLTAFDSSAIVWIEDDDVEAYSRLIASNCRWADPRTARVYDSLDAAQAALNTAQERRWRQAQAQERARERARRDSLLPLLRTATDRPSQIRYCSALTGGGDSPIALCLVREFAWTQGAAETYWQYQGRVPR